MESNPLHPFVIPLYGSSTHFAWGTVGSESAAARLQTFNRFGAIDPQKPYSEFVVSTHADHVGAVLACTPSVSLRDHIQNQVIEVDSSMVDFYSKVHAEGIPYILKVVSVSAPQSLHVHPNDATVKALATLNPESSKGSLAKSVMVVALGNVDMLFGFQAAGDIVGELSRVPEFADAVGRPETDHFVHVVKTAVVKPGDIRVIFVSLLSRKRDFMCKCLEATTERLMKMPEDAVTENDRQLIALHKLYPDDPVCFAVYFLNRVQLDPGHAIFIHPQEPYSVLSGEYIEASTCSEAVVRAGLTEEPIQIEQFLDSLSYDDSPVEVRCRESLKAAAEMDSVSRSCSTNCPRDVLTSSCAVPSFSYTGIERRAI